MTIDLAHIEHPAEGKEVSPPLLIAHGLFGSARNFNTLGRKLATGRRVLMVDMPNHGDSPWTDNVSYPVMADALGRVIERHCGGQAVVLGHSMGGKTAMALALMRPELLAGVVVADIAPVAYVHTHMHLVQGMSGLDLSGVTRRSQADPLMASIEEDPGLRAFLLSNLAIENGVARWRLNLAGLETGMDALVGWPDLSGQFERPTLFVYGGKSNYMKAAHEGLCRDLFPNANFQVIPNAGHWLHAEQPAAFLATVQEWLDRLD